MGALPCLLRPDSQREAGGRVLTKLNTPSRDQNLSAATRSRLLNRVSNASKTSRLCFLLTMFINFPFHKWPPLSSKLLSILPTRQKT
jgi:hypothetical protein